MGKLTPEVFNESCCDGGECSPNDNSARPCGCDPGLKPKPWVCQRHQIELEMLQTRMKALAEELKEKSDVPTNRGE